VTRDPQDAELFSPALRWAYADNNVTVVELMMWSTLPPYPTVYASGTARRDPSDKNDPVTGILLAYSRALANLAKKLERKANGRIKHADFLRGQKQRPRWNPEIQFRIEADLQALALSASGIADKAKKPKKPAARKRAKK
jgi:hypothetical protein